MDAKRWERTDGLAGGEPDRIDEGGLHAPPELHGSKKAWWWFDFIILVNLARLRFIAVLAVIGIVIIQWDTLAAYYDKWTRPAEAGQSAGSGFEYFCPMHPTVIRDNPRDKCPICFMPLSKRKKGATDAAPLRAGTVNRVQLSPYRVVLAGVRTWTVDYVPLTKEITAVGYVEFDERGQRTVASRVAGRMDKLVINETGQMVQAGDELARIYSPDLLVTVQNLQAAKRAGNQALLDSARTRLELLGIDEPQINELLAGPQDANPLLTIRSPISGHVITKYVREGQYVEEGTPLYDVADLSTVWIQAQIYEDDVVFLPSVHAPDDSTDDSARLSVTAAIPALPGREFHGKLTFIYPHVDQNTRTVTVRFELDNPGHQLRPGSTATVTLRVQPRDVPALSVASGDDRSKEQLALDRVLAVPESSVIDTGNQKVVYRQASSGVYEGVEVTLGPRMVGAEGGVFFPVLDGLKPGDMVVTSGSFLVDAETRLNPAAGSIYFGGSGGAGGGRSSVTTARPSTPDDTEADIKAALAKLPEADRRLAQAQKSCPILQASRLGSMGPPVKVMVDGQAVFLCCDACKDDALKDPQATLAKVARLKRSRSNSPEK